MTELKATEQKLPLVVCECGLKLLVVPDLDQMAHNIEEHAAKHGKDETDKKKAAAEHYRIDEQLTQKVLMSICKRSPNKLR